MLAAVGEVWNLQAGGWGKGRGKVWAGRAPGRRLRKESCGRGQVALVPVVTLAHPLRCSAMVGRHACKVIEVLMGGLPEGLFSHGIGPVPNHAAAVGLNVGSFAP